MPEEIALATTDEDYAAFGELIREYWDWLQVRYADLPGFVDAVGGHQALDAELRSLSAKYGPPAGRVILARSDDLVVGGIALRDLGDGGCEMKRLFVPDRFQGSGIGRRLCQALRMYTSLGFRECPPYSHYPAALLTHLTFLERPLTTG